MNCPQRADSSRSAIQRNVFAWNGRKGGALASGGNVGIDFCCASVAVPEQIPDGVEINPVFLEQRGKSMPELMERQIRVSASFQFFFYDGCDGGDSFPFFKYRPRFLFPYSEQDSLEHRVHGIPSGHVGF